MGSPKPTEAQSRALDMSKSVCVSASAGTGKTFILTQRYIEALKTKNIDTGKILALTYTDKAACEMREKTEREIRRRYKETGEFKEVLDNIHKCSVSTFHGFCASLLKEFPLEAGVDPGFSVMDDLNKSELIETTIEDILNNPPEKYLASAVLLYRFLSPTAVKNDIHYLLEHWSDCKPWLEKVKNNPEEVISYTRKVCESKMYEAKEKILGDEKIKELERYLDAANAPARSVIKTRLIYLNNLKNAEDINQIYRALSDLKKEVKLSSFEKFPEIPTESVNHFIAAQKEINIYNPENLTEESLRFVFSVLAAFAEIVSVIYEKISTEKQRAGVLDFDDLVRHTSELMNNEDVVSTLQNRYDYILVDEVQDNDPVLTGIVKKICGNASKYGRLFIVGDVKQSIYGFRGADPKGFYELMGMFTSEPISLDMSFRTVPNILSCVNKMFSDIFKDSEIGYNSITPFRANESGTVTVLKNFPQKDSKERASDMAYDESRLIASWIKENANKLEMYEDGVLRKTRYSDIAVLLQKRTHISELKRALEEYDIPYFEYKGRDFYKSEEIYDIVNLLKSVAFGNDDTSLYGTLSSPYFGVSDEKLCACAAFDTSLPLIERLANSKDEEISKALSTLRHFKEMSYTLTLCELVNYIYRYTGIFSVYAALPSGFDKIANLRKFAEIARERTGGATGGLYSFLRTVDICINEEIEEERCTDDAQESVDETSANKAGENGNEKGALKEKDRVRLLTVHASKGLEYPTVILAFASDGRKGPMNGIYFDERYGVGISLTDATGRRIESFSAFCVKEELEKKEEEELKRLYYVAMTRARDHLVVSLTESSKRTGNASFIGIHEVEGGEIISHSLCEPETISKFEFKAPDDWEVIPVLSGEDEQATAPEFNANEYLLKKGNCLHEIFAGADISRTCERFGFSGHEEEFKADLDKFMSCELMKNVSESFCELELSFGDEKRRIDRLVRYNNGQYAIIDYKLGSPNSSAGICDELMNKYILQLKRYSEMISEMLDAKEPVPAYLYFIGGGVVKVV